MDCPTPRFISTILLSACLLGCGLKTTRAEENIAVYQDPSGDHLVLDFDRMILSLSGSETKLYDCSDAIQFCFTNNDGFAFSIYKKCGASLSTFGKPLKFDEKVASVLHSHSWVIFEESPSFLIHYHESYGIVGIFVASEANQNFDDLIFRDNKTAFDLADLEFEKISGRPIAKCTYGTPEK